MSDISLLNPRIRILRLTSLKEVREDLKAAEMITRVREVAPDLINREEDTTLIRKKIKRAVLKTDIKEIPATKEVAREAATEAASEAATEAVTEAVTEAATEAASEGATESTEVTARDLEDTTQRKVDQAPEALLPADTTIEVAAVATTEWPRPDIKAKVDIALIITSLLSDKMSSLTLKVLQEETFTS